MFGRIIDYYLLKPLTHTRNMKTESELDDSAINSTYTVQQAIDYLKKANSSFGNQIPVNPHLRYLDIGCGMGRLAIGLVASGARSVVGIDVVNRHIQEARVVAKTLPVDVQPDFILSDIHEWQSNVQFDVIFILGAMEHIRDPSRMLTRLASLLKPDGIAFVGHEPFQSPIGDHMRGFFRAQIPWRGILFSEKAILRLRRECFRPDDPVERYQDVVAGLNLMSYSQYVKRVHAAGLEFVAQFHNPQLKHHWKYWPLVPISKLLTSIPVIQDYFIVYEFSILRRTK